MPQKVKKLKRRSRKSTVRQAIDLAEVENSNVSYFAGSDDKDIDFVSSGSTLLDCALGGGYPLGRIVNIVGDASTGKTLMAMEACVNLLLQYPNASVHYCEVEAAFDKKYAQVMGVPIDRVDFRYDNNTIDTVEQLFKDISSVIDEVKDHPAVYIVDSLDALSDASEADKEIDAGSYGATKAKKLSEMFRRLVRKIENKKIMIIIISQVRDNIGVMFGRKTTRSGGKALGFYSSQVIFLAQTGKIERTKNKIKRPVGINIKAKLDKNKVGLPYREAEFPILFGYGIEDVVSMLSWLDKTGGLKHTEYTSIEVKKMISNPNANITDEQYDKLKNELPDICRQVWSDIETGFLPERKKY